MSKPAAAIMVLALPRHQRGVVTMFISMVMLVLITIMVIAAYSLSTTNLRVVGNVQAREEAAAAANLIIEETLQSPFYESWLEVGGVRVALVDLPVDINDDGDDDYLVTMEPPLCVRATVGGTTTSSSVDLPGMTSSKVFNTIWELDATATATATGAKVQVIQAVRILLSETDKDLLCFPPV